MGLINLNCDQCGNLFSRSSSEHKRNLRAGRKVFCGHHCAGKSHARFLPPPNASHLNPGNRKSDLTPFLWHFRNIIRRDKSVGVTVEDLKLQWEKQNGCCPYTGWVMKERFHSNKPRNGCASPEEASLDRIDSSKGYNADNIEFISVIAQYAKHSFTQQQLLDFCRAVATFRPESVSD